MKDFTTQRMRSRSAYRLSVTWFISRERKTRMFRRLGRKKLFVIPVTFLLLSLCVSAMMLHAASAAASTLAQAGAQSGRTIGVAIEANLLGNNPYTTIAETQFDGVTPG